MTCLTPAQCKSVDDRLSGLFKRSARQWWQDNRRAVEDLTLDEVEALALALRRGDTLTAYTMLMTLEKDAWAAYRTETVESLRDLAARRKRAKKMALSLGRWAARTLGAALLGVL